MTRPVAIDTSTYDPNCRACQRLASFLDKVKSAHPLYFCKPVPPFGDQNAWLLIVGLAPGMHGANASGRPFTGDYAGIMLYQTLFDYGWATHPTSLSVDDDMKSRMETVGFVCAYYSLLQEIFERVICMLLELDQDTGKLITGSLNILPAANMAISLARHMNAGNMAFLDGHVEIVMPAKVPSDPSWPAGADAYRIANHLDFPSNTDYPYKGQ